MDAGRTAVGRWHIVLQKTAEYALRAVVYLAQNAESPQSADRVAEVAQIPRRYLHRVLQRMVQAGLVRSQPGPNGGYALAKAPEAIRLIDVIDAFGSIERIRRCPLGLKSHRGLCALHRELDEAYASLEAAFSRVTVAQIVEEPNRYVPLRETR